MRTPRLSHRGPGRRASFALLTLALVLATGTRARAQEVPASAQGSLIRGVEFEGAHAFPVSALQAAIETIPKRCTTVVVFCWVGMGSEPQRLDLETVRADVLRLRLFYYQRGYREAKVEAASTPGGHGLRLTFRVDEGQPIRVASLDVTGVDSVPRDVVGDLPLQRGEAFGTIAYEATRDTLTARMSDRGYAHAQVLASYDLPRDTAGLASVRFEVIPGPLARFDTISILGAHRIAPRVVRRMLTFSPGRPYSQDEVVRSQRNLFGLGVFRQVEIRPDLQAADSLVPVTVELVEGAIHRVRFGAGINTAEALNAEGTWTSRDFYGGARRLEVRGKVSNVLAGPLEGVPFMETRSGKYAALNGSLSVDFLQPWFFAPLNTFGAGLFAQRQSFPGVFVQYSMGGYLTFNRTIGRGATVSLGYRPELTRLDAADDRIFCENLTICDQQGQAQDIQILSSAHLLAPLTLSLARDHSNALFDPTNGSIFRLDGEFAARGTASDFSYWRLVAELSEYREIARGVVLAARVRPGVARSLADPSAGQGLGLHPLKRFFAGGANSVRGFAQYQLGPKVLTVGALTLVNDSTNPTRVRCTVANVEDGSCTAAGLQASDFEVRPVGGAALLEGNFELRFPLGLPSLRGAAFLDYGEVARTTTEFRLPNLIWTPGLGVRYFSAIGPIRVDVGYDTHGAEQLHVLTTRLGTKPVGGTVVCGQAPSDPQELAECGSLHRIQDIGWPLSSKVWDHLQVHFSIGQAF